MTNKKEIDEPKPLEVSWINWDKLTILGCKHLRFLNVYRSKIDYWCDLIDDFCVTPIKNGFWVAREEDPCPKCEHEDCVYYRAPYPYPKRLIILKEKR